MSNNDFYKGEQKFYFSGQNVKIPPPFSFLNSSLVSFLQFCGIIFTKLIIKNSFFIRVQTIRHTLQTQRLHIPLTLLTPLKEVFSPHLWALMLAHPCICHNLTPVLVIHRLQVEHLMLQVRLHIPHKLDIPTVKHTQILLLPTQQTSIQEQPQQTHTLSNPSIPTQQIRMISIRVIRIQQTHMVNTPLIPLLIATEPQL